MGYRAKESEKKCWHNMIHFRLMLTFSFTSTDFKNVQIRNSNKNA
jgi:hypothetical protein